MDVHPGLVKAGIVFLGAGVGGVLRFSVVGGIQTWLRTSHPAWASFPVGTIVVNVTGCFAVGMLGVILAGPLHAKEELRLALLVGLLGGYTTFSAFGRETIMLMQSGAWILALLNVVVSNIAGLLAVLAGDRLATAIFGPTPAPV